VCKREEGDEDAVELALDVETTLTFLLNSIFINVAVLDPGECSA